MLSPGQPPLGTTQRVAIWVTCSLTRVTPRKLGPSVLSQITPQCPQMPEPGEGRVSSGSPPVISCLQAQRGGDSVFWKAGFCCFHSPADCTLAPLPGFPWVVGDSKSLRKHPAQSFCFLMRKLRSTESWECPFCTDRSQIAPETWFPSSRWCPPLLLSPVAAAAKSLQSCLTLCEPIDGSPLGPSLPGILQARTLEWVTISFSSARLHAKSLQSCPTLCDPMDSSPPGSSVPGILQARILEWVAISFYRVDKARCSSQFHRLFAGKGKLSSTSLCTFILLPVKWDHNMNLRGLLQG